MTNLFRTTSESLHAIPRGRLATEAQLETWLASSAPALGLDVLIIGRQVSTAHGGFIDLLALDRDGGIAILELKRDRTPREVIAQALDYASWVRTLTPKDIEEIAEGYLEKSLPVAFQDYYGISIPDTLNATHRMVIIASELDAASRRIVEYLSDQYGVNINTLFFNVFAHNGELLLATDWMIDQESVTEKARARRESAWSGWYFVNAGDEPPLRAWEDLRNYNFIAAGGGARYSNPLKKLQPGDAVFTYQRQRGYTGYGIVTAEAIPARDFLVDGKSVLEHPLVEPGLSHDTGNPDMEEWCVAIDWIKTVPIPEAKTFKGIFANQNIACKLRDPATIEFLKKEFVDA